MIAVLCAMDVESALLVSKMEEPREETLNGLVLTTGRLCGHDVVVGVMNVGKANAAMATQMVIDHFHPKMLLHTGIAGSLSKEAGVLSIVLGESLTFHDLDHQIMQKFYPNQTFFHSDKALMETAEQYLIENGDHYLKGLIATGDTFIESTAQKEAITSRFPALAADMESAAVGLCAHVNGIPFLVIRAISDLADEDSRETYDDNERTAADIGAGIVMRVLERWG